MKTQVGTVYEFGPYRLDVAEFKLLRGSQPVKLRPKLFDLLRLLIERNGTMIEKDELISRLWPDSIVEEGNLTVTVNALRTALSDGCYIETVSKRGYRFAVPVREVSAKSLPGDRTAPPRPSESPGGALNPESNFYICRPTDEEFCGAIAGGDSIVLVKGPRQVGKTSLLARGLQHARSGGAAVVLTDFQQLSSGSFETSENLLLAVAEMIAEQLDLEPAANCWKAFLGPSSNFERFLRREVLAKIASPIVWGLDEIDRLFNRAYASEIFGLFRSWHNLRALDPAGPWQRLTLAIAYATEAHLFITDLNQSPFNVGTRLSLADFDPAQVAELNFRYGSPLRDAVEVSRFHDLLGGHPYLTQRGLYEMIRKDMTLDTIMGISDVDEGPFGDHLQRMLFSLRQDPGAVDELQRFLHSGSVLGHHIISRLRSAGIFSTASLQPKIRCELYSRYLMRHL